MIHRCSPLDLLKPPPRCADYGSMAVLALIGGVAFFFTFRKLDADEDRLNDLKQGQVDELHHSVATKAPE